MTYEYILDMNQSKIPDHLMRQAVANKQQRIREGKFVGQMVNEDADLDIDITKISHMVTLMEYKQHRMRIKIVSLNLPNGAMLNNFIQLGAVYPTIVGKADMNQLTGRFDDYTIKSVGYLTTEIFPVKLYSDTEWNGSHFDEDIFTL